jgi:hypothetical protein
LGLALLLVVDEKCSQADTKNSQKISQFDGRSVERTWSFSQDPASFKVQQTN